MNCVCDMKYEMHIKRLLSKQQVQSQIKVKSRGLSKLTMTEQTHECSVNLGYFWIRTFPVKLLRAGKNSEISALQ